MIARFLYFSLNTSNISAYYVHINIYSKMVEAYSIKSERDNYRHLNVSLG